MTARAFGALTLAASIGLASPWLSAPEPAALPDPTPVAAPATPAEPVASPEQRLHDAVAAAAFRHIPGAAGSDWQPDRIDVTDADDAGMQHIVATGTLSDAGHAGTRVRLSGRYDAADGRLSRVSYRLLPATRPMPESASAAPAWSLQDAVQQSLAQAHPDSNVRFALNSAQASRLERGGRRFEGFGLAVMDGETRFVAFTLDLSAQGQSLAFDFGPEEFEITRDIGLASAAIAD
jgi:hypothetical protein